MAIARGGSGVAFLPLPRAPARAPARFSADYADKQGVEKRLAADLGGALESLSVPAKIEGMALTGSSILYLVLDNDYGFASDGSEIHQIPDLERRALLLRMALPR